MNYTLYHVLHNRWKRRDKTNPYVFHFSGHKLRYMMERLCKRAEVKPFGFHALRRYVASVLADTHKVSSKTIQRILRHKNVSTTERYIQNINHDLESIMDLLGQKGYQARLPNNTKGLGNDPYPFDILWQSQGESNPCLRRERAVPA